MRSQCDHAAFVDLEVDQFHEFGYLGAGAAVFAHFIRRVTKDEIVAAHGGSGKTSVGEAVLFDSGATTRLGSVLDQTSTFDFEPEEIKRQGSISSAFLG